jgi:hypothetical protein
MCEKFKVGKKDEKKLKIKKKLELFISRNNIKTSLNLFKVPSGPKDRKAPTDNLKAGAPKKRQAIVRYPEGREAMKKTSDNKKDVVMEVLKKKKKTKKKKTKTKKNLGQGQIDEGVSSEKIGHDQGSSSREIFAADNKKEAMPPENNPSLYTHLPMDVQGDLNSRTSLIIKVGGPLSKVHRERHLEAQKLYGQFKKEEAWKIKSSNYYTNKIKAKCEDKGTQWEPFWMDAAVSTEDLKIDNEKIMYARVPTYSDAVKSPQKVSYTNNFKKSFGGKAGQGKVMVQDDFTRVSRSRSSKCEECKVTKSVCGCKKNDVVSAV